MVEGFDVRTLALTNFFMSLILGLGLIIFSRVYPDFKGIKHVGSSFLFMSATFLLMGLRDHIPDFLSIIVSNGLYLFSAALLGCGLLQFFSHDQEKPQKNIMLLAIILLLIYLPIFIYFTYYEPSTQYRIFSISLLLVFLYGYLTRQLFNTYKKNIFQRFIRNILFICTFFLACRLMGSLFEPIPNDFMQAGVVHGLNLLSQQLLFMTVSLSLIWSACNELADELSIQATIDPLTKIYNRRGLENTAQKLISQAQRNNTNICVLLLDIDDFKAINDKFGHQIGDQVLIEFSQRLKNNLREYDTLARYGGEEFIVLLPDTELSNAQSIAEKLIKCISNKPFKIQAEAHKKEKTTKQTSVITTSLGLALGQGQELSLEQLIYQADCALYQAKNDGKNRVKTHYGDVIHLN